VDDSADFGDIKFFILSKAKVKI